MMNTKQVIPFLDLKGIHAPYLDTFQSITQDVISNAQFVGGDAVAKFENEFATYCETAGSVGVANGTDSIELSLRALGIGPGDEVITAANTFFATIEAIEHAGARPVLVDCDPNTWLINPTGIEAAITAKTAAIVAVHLYGQPAPMTGIRQIANEHGLAIIEDAAQAHGARHRGTRIGGLSDIASFSFYPGKNLGACGDGGAVTSNDQALLNKVRTLSQHGQSKKYAHEIMGFNSRLDALQARFLSEKLPNLDADNTSRQMAARIYDERLKNLSENLIIPLEREDCESVYHLYVVHVENRDLLQKELAKDGVQTACHYPIPCHLQEASAHLGYSKGCFPVTEFNAGHCLSLPIFPGITEQQQEIVMDRLTARLTSHLPVDRPTRRTPVTS